MSVFIGRCFAQLPEWAQTAGNRHSTVVRLIIEGGGAFAVEKNWFAGFAFYIDLQRLSLFFIG
jgi:hypothetical protein